ncbi:MAG: type II toxin-antitoxin system VapC family toxin [Pirellulales bacterium]|nr:type II toxin-antitoxin system VapC family toxin [Pirellulales bacterium]
MRYLLDTNICIAAMKSHATVVQRLSSLTPNDCVVSTVSVYELFTGVEKCANPDVERVKVETLLDAVHQVSFDSTSAQTAARIRSDLESAGRTIGPYDLLLAGQAMAMQLVLVTANVSEFQRVAGLTVENWE